MIYRKKALKKYETCGGKNPYVIELMLLQVDHLFLIKVHTITSDMQLTNDVLLRSVTYSLHV